MVHLGLGHRVHLGMVKNVELFEQIRLHGEVIASRLPTMIQMLVSRIKMSIGVPVTGRTCSRARVVSSASRKTVDLPPISKWMFLRWAGVGLAARG